MRESGVLWTHWGHLATKPVIACVLWWFASGWIPMVWAVGLALGGPMLASAVRKQILWPGCFRHRNVWQDELADLWASALGVVPFVVGWPGGGLVAVGGVLVLVGGLHRWALP